jgi:hypothetical protein
VRCHQREAHSFGNVPGMTALVVGSAVDLRVVLRLITASPYPCRRLP